MFEIYRWNIHLMTIVQNSFKVKMTLFSIKKCGQDKFLGENDEQESDSEFERKS